MGVIKGDTRSLDYSSYTRNHENHSGLSSKVAKSIYTLASAMSTFRVSSG